MKFTPLDIQRREFEKAFRGLDEGEVRAFLHELASEWEELQVQNNRLREEVLDLRERNRQYQDQDRIFRETLLQAQRTKEDVLEAANREKDLLIREAQFKADEIVREAQGHVAELEATVRNLRMERMRFLEGLEHLMDRTKRFLFDEAPERAHDATTLNLDELGTDPGDSNHAQGRPKGHRRAPHE